MFGDSDLGVFFADMGVPVIWNGEPAVQGILDTTTDDYMHGQGPGGFQKKTAILRFPANSFSATPAPRDAITVNGVSYTVLELPEQRDMQITELYLKAAS